jgi:thioredoxin-related protein
VLCRVGMLCLKHLLLVLLKLYFNAKQFIKANFVAASNSVLTLRIVKQLGQSLYFSRIRNPSIMKNLIIVLFLLTQFDCLAYESDVSAHEKTLSEAMVNPGFYEKPKWFKQSFLDLQEDLEDAKKKGRRIVLYFHQDGCPYCRKLLADNFSRQDIVKKMTDHYDLLAINMWGDKTITTIEGEELSEKDFSLKMQIMFTPTLVFLDENGKPEFRMNGYYSGDKFLAVLNYLLLDAKQKKSGFNHYLKQYSALEKDVQYAQLDKAGMSKSSFKFQTEKFLYRGKNLHQLIEASEKPVMILFEQKNCPECNELHGDIFRRLPVYKKLKYFAIAQIDINSEKEIIAPNGQSMTQMELAKKLNIQYTPSIFFYQSGQNQQKKQLEHEPVFRSQAYLKSFHFQAILDYISNKIYRTEPEFQRFVQRRADQMRGKGIEVKIWD